MKIGNVRIDTKKLEEHLRKYDWKDLEYALEEVQLGINLLTWYFMGKKDFAQAGYCTILYTDFVKIARELRRLMEEEELLTIEDYDEVQKRREREGKELDDVIIVGGDE